MFHNGIIKAASTATNSIFTTDACARIGAELCAQLSNATNTELLNMARNVDSSWSEMIRFFIMLAIGFGVFVMGERHLHNVADIIYMTVVMLCWLYINIYMESIDKKIIF